MVKALDVEFDRQQWFEILEASEGREVAYKVSPLTFHDLPQGIAQDRR